MTAPEFSRPVRVDALGEAPRSFEVEANANERAALARRFGLTAIERLTADLQLSTRNGAVSGAGVIVGEVTQTCVVTGEPVPAHVEADFEIEFRPEPESSGHDEEIELGASELDTIFYDDGTVDVGEAVAQTLALNLDPYPRAAGAEEILKAAGVRSEEEAGPFAALAGLKDKLKGG